MAPPDPTGRHIDHPNGAELRAELLAKDRGVPVSLLVPFKDSEAMGFAQSIEALLTGEGFEVSIQAVAFDPPFRGMQMYAGEDKIQLAIGHRLSSGLAYKV